MIFDSLAFDLAFTTFISLFHFSWDPWYLRRPVVCENVISKQYNLMKLFERNLAFRFSVCLSIRMFIRPLVHALLKSPWDHPRPPGGDLLGWPWPWVRSTTGGHFLVILYSYCNIDTTAAFTLKIKFWYKFVLNWTIQDS